MNKLHVILLSIAAICALWLFTNLQKAPTVAQSSDVLVVGTNTDYPPFSFIKDGKLTGFEIDVVQELGKRLNKNLDYKDMAFTNLMPELQSGKIQIVAAGMTPTPERAKRVLFAPPHLAGDPLVIVTMNPNKVTGLEDLRGKEVVVNEGYVADSYMTQWSGAQLTRLITPADSFLALKSGRAFAYVDTKAAITPFFQQYGTQEFSMIPIANSEQTTALAISPKYPELLDNVQKILHEMREDGTLDALAKKWGLA